MEIYIIRASNPLDMEGSADVVACFLDKNVADEAAGKLKAEQEAGCRKVWKDRWRSFAIDYEVEAHPVQTSADDVVSAHSNFSD
jgi:hypothetical protein